MQSEGGKPVPPADIASDAVSNAFAAEAVARWRAAGPKAAAYDGGSTGTRGATVLVSAPKDVLFVLEEMLSGEL